MLLGLTGGIGAGKSTALAAFGRQGCPTLSSDAVVHGLYRDPDVRAAVVERFGPDALAADGEVSRPALATRVFSDDIARRWLERLLHPLVGAAFERWRGEQEALDADAVIVHEVPLLFEANLAGRYDAVVLITAPDAVRRERSPERFDERAGAQMPEAQKIARANYSYVNDGTPEDLERWVADLVARLRAA
jgi:dephospho-CoA kinase